METLNICVATYRLTKGNGIDVSVYQFARELAKDHNVTLAVTDTDMDVGEFDVLRYRIGAGAGIFAAARDLDKANFDLISTHYPPFDLVASMTHIPHYMHEPGIPPLRTFSSAKDRVFWSKVSSSRLFSLRNVRCVLPISEYLGREFLRKYLYHGPMEVLPYGIDFPSEGPAGDNPFKKYVLYIGRHAPYKGVHTLMDIFQDVKKEVSDARLVTIGNMEKGYKDRLEALASKIGGVHMLGYVPDVWPYLRDASVYATCSAWEGQDRPVIEAQYMGKPAVTFDNCSHPEVVVYGTLARDREEFKEALIKYLSSDHTDLAARDRIRERYSMRRMAGQFMDIVKRTG
jgi:glycosyltransferase involved in cell wall biosynthesis